MRPYIFVPMALFATVGAVSLPVLSNLESQTFHHHGETESVKLHARGVTSSFPDGAAMPHSDAPMTQTPPELEKTYRQSERFRSKLQNAGTVTDVIKYLNEVQTTKHSAWAIEHLTPEFRKYLLETAGSELNPVIKAALEKSVAGLGYTLHVVFAPHDFFLEDEPHPPTVPQTHGGPQLHAVELVPEADPSNPDLAGGTTTSSSQKHLNLLPSSSIKKQNPPTSTLQSLTNMSSLEKRLTAALMSREDRLIRRRLSEPAADAGLIDFHTNDYLSLSQSQDLRTRFLTKLQNSPDVLGSGGSRLLVNGHAHSSLEARLARFFDSPTALLFNSGLDANVGFFSCIPQPGDVVVCDEYIHASVHDGIRASRVKDAQLSFEHNDLTSLGELLLRLVNDRRGLRSGENSVFVAVESLYSMDGTIAPLTQIVEMLETLFPKGNGYLVVDEAHATGIYGPQGKGLVSLLGLERRVLARLHTFGKALAGSGAVILTSELIRDYLLNYARSLIYTTALSYAQIISVDCSFDMLEDGTAKKLSSHLLKTSAHFVTTLRFQMETQHIPAPLLSLPPHLAKPPADDLVPALTPMFAHLATPIIPVMTCQPRPLSAYLRKLGMNARPITWPTVPKGRDRIRVCLHYGNSREEVERLATAMIEWAKECVRQETVTGVRETMLPIHPKL
ncbi:pyridoxal phosphate-dependent transferase [Cytidiella melzeri]|nr:pyridoxal phosphate-dependent transferase [Cytidiella melzeri]